MKQTMESILCKVEIILDQEKLKEILFTLLINYYVYKYS